MCPSLKKEFGLAVLEAMEAGLPVFAPQRGGIPHHLRDAVNGILLDTSSVASLSRGPARLRSCPEGGRVRLANAGRETVSPRFSAAVMADPPSRQHAAVCGSPDPNGNPGRGPHAAAGVQ